eukprot:766389-Hanusia_phi.AAC.3
MTFARIGLADACLHSVSVLSLRRESSKGPCWTYCRRDFGDIDRKWACRLQQGNRKLIQCSKTSECSSIQRQCQFPFFYKKEGTTEPEAYYSCTNDDAGIRLGSANANELWCMTNNLYPHNQDFLEDFNGDSIFSMDFAIPCPPDIPNTSDVTCSKDPVEFYEVTRLECSSQRDIPDQCKCSMCCAAVCLWTTCPIDRHPQSSRVPRDLEMLPTRVQFDCSYVDRVAPLTKPVQSAPRCPVGKNPTFTLDSLLRPRNDTRAQGLFLFQSPWPPLLIQKDPSKEPFDGVLTNPASPDGLVSLAELNFQAKTLAVTVPANVEMQAVKSLAFDPNAYPEIHLSSVLQSSIPTPIVRIDASSDQCAAIRLDARRFASLP